MMPPMAAVWRRRFVFDEDRNQSIVQCWCMTTGWRRGFAFGEDCNRLQLDDDGLTLM
ncbi:hypothetical protein K3N28_15495 [Glycomyces sp. TRM65418]|uniref:hypothetical protein n=1 Tax=Glycomyces sp. TRM65418 TaxID=2867006 RepID=UPI001CE5F245|nr:hypothetical protein [Glycomyces sp. TRM65418]MCC3764467.1 hypothetical protein [Glycomyces sp. TRM65418]QZD54140.1 hypothetical protein K3N28_15420 [Glycomyces sp. TRM65418]